VQRYFSEGDFMRHILLVLSFWAFGWSSLQAQDSAPPAQELKARIKTTMGEIEIRLFHDKAPQTVSNFVTLARQGFFKGHLFHRVIPGFMVQTGDPEGNGTGGPGYTFADEFRPELKHDKAGIVSMANSGKDTNGSQFFITVAPTPHLDGKHTVFGEVTQGLETVLAISNVKTNGTTPEKEIKIENVDILGTWYKPQDVIKIKQYSEDEIRKFTHDFATQILKKIADLQQKYGKYQTSSLVAARSRGSQVQAYYKADFSDKKELQLVLVGEIVSGKFVMKQVQFAEPEEG
jgi:cyclophilin family peptidyl-prolyl cis-trans isomerase